MIATTRAAFYGATLLALLAGIAFGILSQSPVGLKIDTGNLPTTPCPTEDSANCYWDATVSGNGTGQSFYNVNGWLIIKTEDAIEGSVKR